MADLEQALVSLKDDGRWDSSGHFELDPKVAQAMQAHGWPQPGFFLLKVFQGLVALGCSAIHVSQSYPRLEVKASHPRPEELLRERYSEAVDGGSGPYDLLASGLRTALHECDSVILRVGQDHWLNHGNGKPPRKSPIAILLQGRGMKDVLSLVLERCWHMPIQFRWDGHRLDQYGRPRMFSVGPGYFSEREPLLAELTRMPETRPEALGHVKSGRMLPTEARVLKHRWKRLYPVLYHIQTVGPPLRVCIPQSPSGRSCLVPVQHGVTLDPVNLVEDFGCLVIVEVSGLPVDLSGFKPRRSEQLSVLQAEARGQLAELATAALQRVAQLEQTPKTQIFKPGIGGILARNLQTELIGPCRQFFHEFLTAGFFADESCSGYREQLWKLLRALDGPQSS